MTSRAGTLLQRALAQTLRAQMQMLSWDDLRFFLAISRTGTLQGAARKLGVAQTTVGRRLRAAEEVLRLRLFDRTPDGLVPTIAGKALMPHAEQVEAQMNEAVLAVKGHDSTLSGLLRVTAPTTLGSTVLVPIAAEFLTLHPEVEVEMLADARTFDLARREADVAVRMARPTEPSVVTRKLVDVAVGVYASSDYLRRRGTPAEDLRGHDVVAFAHSFHPPVERAWLEENGAGARIVFRANSVHMAAEAVASGMGLGVFPAYLAASRPELVLVRPQVAAATIWLAVHEELQRTPRVRVFVDHLVQALDARREWLLGLS